MNNQEISIYERFHKQLSWLDDWFQKEKKTIVSLTEQDQETIFDELSKNWKRLEKTRIIKGVETARWPGRLEIISENPRVIVDGAHNKEGAMALRKYIKEFISKPIVLVFAVMRDKNIEKLSEILFPLAHKVICTKFPFHKAAKPEDILRRASPFEDRIVIQPDVQMAVQTALQAASSGSVVVGAGSLFLVGEIKKICDEFSD